MPGIRLEHVLRAQGLRRGQGADQEKPASALRLCRATRRTHFHPGEEIIYILNGSLEYAIDDQETKVYNAGEALTVPAGVIHAVRNVGTSAATELATYVVEKGKPLLTVAK